MQPDQQLSPHFRLSEFTHSQTAVRMGINNDASFIQIGNLRRLALAVELARTALGDCPIISSSGLRVPALNLAVGGAPDSAHLDGRALDFTAPRYGGPQQICRRLVEVGIEFDQLIFEGTWVHFGIPVIGVEPRRQVLTAVFTPGQRTRYVLGIQ